MVREASTPVAVIGEPFTAASIMVGRRHSRNRAVSRHGLQWLPPKAASLDFEVDAAATVRSPGLAIIETAVLAIDPYPG